MSSITASDLKIVTRLLALLRKKYQVNFSYQDPQLAPLLAERLIVLQDVELNTIWNQLTPEFRSQKFAGQEAKTKKIINKNKASKKTASKTPAHIQNSQAWLNSMQFQQEVSHSKSGRAA